MAAPIEAVHLWASDSDGEVHVLCHVRSSNKDVSMRWREGDGGQREVFCGKGVVCGIDMKTDHLCLRRGLAFDSPIGKKWAISSQKVSKVAVGSKYVSVLTNNNQILAGRPKLHIIGDLVGEFLLTEVEGPLPKNLEHLIMDSNDVLYAVTSMGEVYVCRGMASEAETIKLEIVSKAPPLARRGGFLRSLFSSKKNLFVSVTALNDQLFCLRKDPQEIWQLVITEVVFGDKTCNKTSWNSFKFGPNPPNISLITANPLHSAKELFGVVEEDGSIVCLQLEGKTITVSELPFHGCGDIKITSLSASHLVQDLNEAPLMASTPKLYPKLPKLHECCEKGDCNFCERKNTSQSVIEMSDPDWDTKYRTELANSIAQWQRGDEYTLPRLVRQGDNTMDIGGLERRQLIGKKRHWEADPYLTTAIEETPPSKRRCKSTEVISKRQLLEGINLSIRNDNYHYLSMLPDPLSTVVSSADIASEFQHSFDLEQQVVDGQDLTLKNIINQSCLAIETESRTDKTESYTEENEPDPKGQLVVGNESPPKSTKYYTAKPS